MIVDNGWRNEVIYQVYVWWIRNITTHYLDLLGIWKSRKFVFGIALCLLRATKLSKTDNYNCPKNDNFDHYMLGA